MKKLYFGDCLDILKQLHHEKPDGFVDLIYIDPPFNSKRNYNVLFEDLDMKDTKAQREAFSDTWSNVSYIDTLNELATLDYRVHDLLKTLDKIEISTHAVSYLTTMAIRIYYMHKVLKPTGSFYLHCDPNMSHYLKLVCDLIFGEKNFVNEIIWHYKRWPITQKAFQRMHDVILFYQKGNEEQRVFNTILGERAESTLRRWKDKKIVARHDEDGNRIPSISEDDTSEGVAIDDVWNISIIAPSAKERRGYPTQKPEALLERIIEASSNKGDLVADFFCGCGTTIAVANKLERNWLGVDISHLAIKLIIDRLTDPYPEKRAQAIKDEIEISGFPRDIASAKELAENTVDGRYTFQSWIVEVMLGGILNPKRTGDGGWDGYITFDKPDGEKGRVIIEVKSGNVNVKNMREFVDVVKTMDADIGIYVCFAKQVTQPMEKKVKEQGYFDEQNFGTRIPKIQIITVEDLLDGKEIRLPGTFYKKTTFKKATVGDNRKLDEPKLFE
jgi:site-specific DNA-methyltransferase (adenine-specific)